jgi:putative tricarboxylic transport membrane protein
MHDSQDWQDALAENGWTDDFKTDDEFAAFLEEQDDRVSGTLEELGLI